MQYRTLGSEGPRVSVVGIGTWVTGGDSWGTVDDRESVSAIRHALDRGVNFIDTAPSYGDGRAESVVGKAVKGLRERPLIATKCGLRRVGKKYTISLKPRDIRRDLEESLRRLEIETIDLYQCHWPDPGTPVEETMKELLRMRDEGSIRFIGVSNCDRALLHQARGVAPVVSLQARFSLLEQTLEGDLLPFCRENGIGIVTYGSLGGGILSGKYAVKPNLPKKDARSFFYRYYREPAWSGVQELVSTLGRIAAGRGKPPAQAAINWVLQQPGITSVLAGLRTAEQASVNAGSADWELMDEEINELRCVSQRIMSGG